MFGNISNDNKQQPEAPDENVREESQLENNLDSIRAIGNEAAQEFLPFSTGGGNNFINNIIDDDIPSGKSKKLDLRISNSWMDEILGKDDEEKSDQEQPGDNFIHMNLISLLNYGIIYIDELYANTVRGGKSDEENPDNIREEMTQKKYTLKAGGREAEFTPTHYESYIQIYKDPKIAVAKYNCLLELRKKRDERGAWTNKSKPVIAMHNVKSHVGLEKRDEMSYDEFVELKKLELMEKLALQFDNAHNYMIEKDQYSQQDIDYAFRLNYREKYGERKEKRNEIEIQDEPDFRDDYKSASGIYISLFLDKIFHELKEAWVKAPEEDRFLAENIEKTGSAFKWIDDFFMGRLKSKKNEFQMIIRGLTRAMKAADPKGKLSYEKLYQRFRKCLSKYWSTEISVPPKRMR